MNFVNFEEQQLHIIFDALDFVKQKIEWHYKFLAAQVDTNIDEPIWDEMGTVMRPITATVDFFKKNIARRFITLNDDDFSYFMDTIRSALEIYKQHLGDVRKSTGIDLYDDLIREVEKISNLGGPSKARNDLFLKYYVEEQHSNKRLTVFISYQDKDAERACRLRKLLISNSSKISEQDVFVAHRDIPLTEEWRKSVIAQLEISTHLIALCTENYICSSFGNQEVGFAMAKNVKIVSLFWEGTDRKRYGFLESFQALPNYVNDATLEETVKQLLRKLDIE